MGDWVQPGDRFRPGDPPPPPRPAVYRRPPGSGTKIAAAIIGTVMVSAAVFLVGVACYAAYLAVAG